MPLDIGSLEKSVAALRAAVAKSEDGEFMRGLDEVARNTMRSGVIQHFEFTYELCWKFMKRWLETNVSPAIADGVTRRELFRLAAESLLIGDIERWMRHHDARNVSSHTYDLAVAGSVYQAAREFVPDAQRVLDALKARND